VALETKIDSDGCSKKAKVRKLFNLLASLVTFAQLAASSAEAACRVAKEKVSEHSSAPLSYV
jgi:hypothetical protein